LKNKINEENDKKKWGPKSEKKIKLNSKGQNKKNNAKIKK
jgi:hypothetical protein